MDAAEAFTQSVENGAIPVLEPVTLVDAQTGTMSVMAEVKLYGDVVLRYISGTYEVGQRYSLLRCSSKSCLYPRL